MVETDRPHQPSAMNAALVDLIYRRLELKRE